MPAPVTVIIPTLNAEKGLVDCFVSLSEGLNEGLIGQVIVVDAGSTDRTAEIADRWGAILLRCDIRSRGAQLRQGAAAAKSDHLLFLHADTRLSEGWAHHVSLQLGKTPACFRLAFRSPHFLARVFERWANLRTRLFGLPYGDQGLLISMADYQGVGGFADQPLMEDVAMARSLKTITLLPVVASTDAGKYERDGWVRRGFSNITTLIRYLFGVDPETLVKQY